MPIKINTKKVMLFLLFGEGISVGLGGDFISCEKQFGWR